MRSVYWIALAVGCGPAREVCGDGSDNDRDGAFDCDDADCSREEVCLGSGPRAGNPSGTPAALPTGTSPGDSNPTWTPTGTPSGSTSTFSITTTWVDDGANPPSGCADELQVTIQDPLGVTAWDLGLAETGSPSGWTGEDCLLGYAGYAFCHPIGVDHVLAEVADCLPSSVVPGSTTLLDASLEPALTYYLSDGTSCFVWGDDVSYFAALGCMELM